jgi:riboflavin kinase
LRALCLKGRVFSGRGEGSKFVDFPWVKVQLIEKLDFVPYSGTLNLMLTEGLAEFRKMLKKAKTMEIQPTKGFCRGKLFRAYVLDNLECAIVVPDMANYPKDIVEIVASTNLREKYNLKDGDIVEVKVMV